MKNVTGTPTADLGITSSKNGAIPFGLVVEQSVTQAVTGVTVYPDLTSRPATGNVGDQAMVLDQGNGEWALYIWDGSNWTEISNKDSAATDANSLQLILTPLSAVEVIGTISSNSRVSLITVEVTTPFDGSPSLTIGDDVDTDRLMSDSLHDLSSNGVYSASNDFLYTGGDTDIKAYFSSNGATVGEALITISYS